MLMSFTADIDTTFLDVFSLAIDRLANEQIMIMDSGHDRTVNNISVIINSHTGIYIFVAGVVESDKNCSNLACERLLRFCEIAP